MHDYARASLFHAPERDADEDRHISLMDVVQFMGRWRRTIAVVTGVFVLAATAYAYMAEPLYTAYAQVMLDSSQARDMLDDPNRVVLPADQARVESHIEIIRSDQLALDVIRKLHLTKLPEFNAPTGVKDREGYAVVMFARGLSARRIGQSLVIEVSFRFGDPALAASIVNTLIDAYVAREMQVKSDSIEQADRWLFDKQASLDRQSQAALAELERYKAQSDGAPDRAAKIEDLQNRAQIYQRMHDAFLQKFNEAIQKVAFPEPDVRVIAPAGVPLQKSYPKRGLIIGLAALFGIGVGLLIAVVRQNLDRTLRNPSQLKGVVDCFGVVSQVPGLAAAAGAAAKRAKGGLRFLRRSSPAGGPALHFAADHPHSTLNKDLRSIKVAVDCATNAEKCRFVGVVAAREGEGATTIAANLASIYAASGLRTLIADACPDNPTLTRELVERPQDAGGKRAHMGERALAARPNVMRAGHLPRLERFGSQEGGRHGGDLDALAQEYEIVIFDLPALASSPDARAIARFLDAVILVAQVDATSLDTVYAAVDALRHARAGVIGLVLNKANVAGRPARARAGWLAAFRGA